MGREAYALCLIITFIFTNTYTAQTVAFTEGFDYNQDLEDNGYILNHRTTAPFVAENRENASYIGERGLFFQSTPAMGLANNIFRPMNTPISQNSFLQYYIFVESSWMVFRIVFGSDDTSDLLGLDFGRPDIGTWHTFNVGINVHIYNAPYDYLKNSWNRVYVDINEVVTNALTEPRAPVNEYTISRVDNMEFYHDIGQTQQRVVSIQGCLDAITISDSEIKPFVSTLNSPCTEKGVSDVSSSETSSIISSIPTESPVQIDHNTSSSSENTSSVPSIFIVDDLKRLDFSDIYSISAFLVIIPVVKKIMHPKRYKK